MKKKSPSVSVRKHVPKTFTPFDHMLFFVIDPGNVQEPDHRCLARLVATLLSKENLFYDLVPFPAHTILQSARDIRGEKIPEVITLAWWKMNNFTTFVHNKKTAKIIRRALRLEKKTYQERIRWRH